MDITITLTDKQVAGVQTACDAWNTEQEAAWNAEQLGLPEDERTPYSAINAQRYFKERCAEMVGSYVRDVDAAQETTLTRRFRRLTDEEKANLLATLPAE